MQKTDMISLSGFRGLGFLGFGFVGLGLGIFRSWCVELTGFSEHGLRLHPPFDHSVWEEWYITGLTPKNRSSHGTPSGHPNDLLAFSYMW